MAMKKKTCTVIAVLCSDIHLCHTCPPARSNESNWYDAMARVLHELGEIARHYNVPIFCAGDVFDRWNSPPELINFAFKHMHMMYSIPGQHDLPNHSLEDIQRSAYWSLVDAGVIVNLIGSTPHVVEGAIVHAFPWGVPIDVPSDGEGDMINVALSHRYAWKKGKGYPGASMDAMIGNIPNLDNYDVAVFGDNHQSFDCRKSPTSKCTVVNPGCLIPRKSDERKYHPSVYLLRDDKTVQAFELGTLEDKWIDEAECEDAPSLSGMESFLEELRSLDADSLDFSEAVNRYCEDRGVPERTRVMIRESMGAES
jgi:hypothetical protein